jgi:tetratricopeptide (TPR) repeat protein
VIDEELLQELLAKASSLYNNGDYQGAIEAWNEVLNVDPSNCKAREGIQMSHLLIGDWAPTPEEGDGSAAQPADGGQPDNVALTPEEVESRLGEGVARVKSLLAERRYSEALEGAKSLVPIDPESEDVQRLIEEAQQSFESAPFIEEHLTLARELLAQERCAEAEAECHKVFALDRSNPEATDLLAQMGKSARETSSDKPDEGGEGYDLELIDIPEAPAAAGGEAPSSPEDTSAPEIVEAKEIVPPSVRLIPRSDEGGDPAAPLLEDPTPQAAAPEAPVPDAAVPDGPGEDAPQQDAAAWETELAQLNLKEGEKDILGETPPTVEAPSADSSADADLMSLLDDDFAGSGGEPVETEEPVLGGLEAIPLADSPPAEPAPGEMEQGPPAAPADPAEPIMPAVGEPLEAIPVAPQLEQPQKQLSGIGVDEEASPPEPRRAARPPVAVARPVEARSNIPKYFALLGLVILVTGGAAWWFLFRPSPAGAHGAPGGTAAPPAGSSSSPPVGADAGPIPTPIGAPTRKPARQSGEKTAAAGVAPSAGTVTPPAPAPRQVPDLSPLEVERRIAAHLSRGRRLLSREDWHGVQEEMQAAMALDPFNLQVRGLADQAQARIADQEKLQQELAEVRRLFDGKDYQSALWKLYRLPRDPAVGDVDLYVRNAWYNWAVVSMRAGNNGDTLEKIGEALLADPGDAKAQKIQGFAERYSNRAKDNLYYNFADALELRAFDQR